MNKSLSLLIMIATLGLTYAAGAQAYEGDWKRGRVYFRQVCTNCHLSISGKAISPAEKMKAEWNDYLVTDKHDVKGKSNHSVKYYVSREFRQSIANENKAAQKFLDVPNTELNADIHAFVVYGAKDSDNPSRCQ
ncbi:MAG: hypothetical protein OEY27_01910 [Gammaproteobacteria bacterium]|nr:hypothetical protein [Gammaproteobacteria bacterium]